MCLNAETESHMNRRRSDPKSVVFHTSQCIFIYGHFSSYVAIADTDIIFSSLTIMDDVIQDSDEFCSLLNVLHAMPNVDKNETLVRNHTLNMRFNDEQ